jgi:signal transduction histidine kinase
MDARTIDLVKLKAADLDTFKTKINEKIEGIKEKQKPRKKCIIHPDNPILAFWPYINFSTTLYTSLIGPVRITFLDAIPLWWQVFEFVIDFFILVDIIISLKTAYQDDKENLVVSHCPIFFLNLRTWLFWDILSIFPYIFSSTENVGFGNFSDIFKVIRIARLYRLFRLNRMANFFQKIQRNPNSRESKTSSR